jgi:hypothetical protein
MCYTATVVLALAYDYDGLDEFFDKGAYHKLRTIGLRRIIASIAHKDGGQYVPLVVGFLFLVSGDYISLLRLIRIRF